MNNKDKESHNFQRTTWPKTWKSRLSQENDRLIVSVITFRYSKWMNKIRCTKLCRMWRECKGETLKAKVLKSRVSTIQIRTSPKRTTYSGFGSCHIEKMRNSPRNTDSHSQGNVLSTKAFTARLSQWAIVTHCSFCSIYCPDV